MPGIEVIRTHTVYDNPVPHLRSRHGYFPGLAELPSGDLLALFAIGEAFEAVDLTTCVLRSSDGGETWGLEGPLCDRTAADYPVSDFLKPTVLSDGSVIAIGYRFHRLDPDDAIGNPLTNGILPGDDLVSFSSDEGRTWTVPNVIHSSRPELLEISGPCIELRSGDLLACGCPYPMWDGSNPSGQIGVLLRSGDRGRSWEDGTLFFSTPDSSVTPFEPRVCEMQDGRLVCIVWAYHRDSGRNLTNHVTVSHDEGRTWSAPADTGVPGQASNLLWLGGDQLLTIHAQREGDLGIFVRIVDFSGDKWRVRAESSIWGPTVKGRQAQGLAAHFANLKFGQPSIVRMSGGEYIAVHWCVENGQGRILAHRLRISD